MPVVTKLTRATGETELQYLSEKTFAEVTQESQAVLKGRIVFMVRHEHISKFYAIGQGTEHLLELDSKHKAVLTTKVRILTSGDVVTMEVRG